jgi:hypothetical protein
VRAVIKDHASAKQVSLIGLLNPIIDGWVNYHRHVVSKEVYRAVDTAIWQALPAASEQGRTMDQSAILPSQRNAALGIRHGYW